MSEWIEFTGTVSTRKTRQFSLKKHLKAVMNSYDGEFHYSETSTDLDTLRITKFSLVLLSSKDIIPKLQAALREVPGTVSSVWVEGWLEI